MAAIFKVIIHWNLLNVQGNKSKVHRSLLNVLEAAKHSQLGLGQNASNKK